MRLGNRAIAGTIISLAAAGLIYSWRIAPRWLSVVRLRIAIPALPEDWDGLRIAHLSDFHAGGPGVALGLLHEAKRIALNVEPDIVALTGDFYDDGDVFDTGDLFTKWPSYVSTIAVLGNHDFRGGPYDLERLIDQLTSAGVSVLRNAAMTVPIRGLSAWIVGVDDPHTWQSNEDQAFSDLPADVEALLYLAHSPSAVTTMPIARAKVMLSGHTHGGQLRLLPSGRIPFIRQMRTILRSPQMRDPDVFRGIHWIRGTLVIISNGIGVTDLPLRLRTRPQIVVIELTNALDDGLACDTAGRYVEEIARQRWWMRWLS